MIIWDQKHSLIKETFIIYPILGYNYQNYMLFLKYQVDNHKKIISFKEKPFSHFKIHLTCSNQKDNNLLGNISYHLTYQPLHNHTFTHPFLIIETL